MKRSLSRREFFARSALYSGSLWVALHVPRPRALQAARETTRPLVFDADQWRTVEALVARIIPTDDAPGATEAGCVHFIDKALAHEDAALREAYVGGLARLAGVTRRRFDKRFVELSPEQRDAVLMSLEDGVAEGWPSDGIRSQDFFEMVRAHAVYGFLADPRYGGNRDYVGWRFVGYPGPRHHTGGYAPKELLGEAPIRAIWGDEL